MQAFCVLAFLLICVFLWHINTAIYKEEAKCKTISVSTLHLYKKEAAVFAPTNMNPTAQRTYLQLACNCLSLCESRWCGSIGAFS